MASPLLNLPVELLLRVFSYLPPRELLFCRYTCCRLRDIILGDRVLQRRLQSLEHCMKEFSPSSSSISDFLKNMEDMEKTSSTFGPGEDVSMRTEFEPFQSFHKFEFFGDSETTFLLRSGYLIQMRKGNDPGWAYMNLSPKYDVQGYTPALEWKSIHLEGNGIMGWALDLDQDLVAVSLLPYEDLESFFLHFDLRRFRGYQIGDIEIRLIQFTNGKKHKSANKAVIQLDPLGWYDMEFKTHIAIMGGYLVVLVTHYTSPNGIDRTGKYQTVYFVDWVKGHVIHKWQAFEDTYFPVLASISENSFVVGLKREWALELWEITEKNGTSRIRSRRKLQLPALQPHTRIILEKIDETSSGTGRPSALRHLSTLPVPSESSDSLLAFHVGASSRSGEKQAFLFSVFKSALHDFTVTTRTTRWRKHRGPYIVPWIKWGSESTRWINIEDFPIIRALSGTRCVISETSTGRVRMLDFNPERLPWIEDWIKRRNGETGRWDWLAMTSPTTILAGKVFQYNIESKLPYYELRKTGVRAEAGFTYFIDDKWAVLIRPGKCPRFIDDDDDS